MKTAVEAALNAYYARDADELRRIVTDLEQELNDERYARLTQVVVPDDTPPTQLLPS